MCRPASFVVTREFKAFWSKKSDSHEDIISEHGLNEGSSAIVDDANFVRVEIVPPDDDMRKPLNEWLYKLDQSENPSWYDAEKAEKTARTALKDWADARLFINRDATITDCGAFAFNCKIEAWGSSRVEARESSRVEAWGSSRVVARGSSRVVARESSRVEAWESSRVEAWGSSSIEAWESSRVEAWESSSVVAWESSSVVAWGSSRVVARESSRVEARESSRVEAWGSSSVVARGSSSIEAWESSRVEAWGGIVRFFVKLKFKITGKLTVAIDMTGDVARCFIGDEKEREIDLSKE